MGFCSWTVIYLGHIRGIIRYSSRTLLSSEAVPQSSPADVQEDPAIIQSAIGTL